jgi:hypothetical protein
METNPTLEKTLVLTDLIETSGLMRSNMLEKLAYLKIYVLKSPIFVPFKISVKAVLIQSEDLISRSRLISDDNVHRYKIKEFLNVFEVKIKLLVMNMRLIIKLKFQTETLQNIDLSKIEVKELSKSFELLSIDLEESVSRDSEINIEPSSECLVNVENSGQLHAVLYWYELHLTQQIIVSSSQLGPNWHLAAFIVKDATTLHVDDKISISCMFTNGFLRLKLKSVPNH